MSAATQTPALKSSDAWIVAQMPANLIPLLEGADFCDELWPIEPRSAGVRALRAEAARVAQGRFDRGVIIPESISSALRMRWGRVGRIIGFARDPLRRLLLDEVVPAPREWGRRRLISREVLLGVIEGVMLGAVVGIVAYVWKGSYMLGVVLGVAMIGNMLIGAMTGAGIPLVLRSLRIDPAVSSAVFVTTFTDVMGVLLFLGLATLLVDLL